MHRIIRGLARVTFDVENFCVISHTIEVMTQGVRYVVGIDLGTTNTVVAYALVRKDEGKGVELLPIPQLVAMGEVSRLPTLPSARFHAAPGELSPDTVALGADDVEGERVTDVVVGAFAQSLGAKVPGRLVTSAKSWLSHGAVDRLAPILPWGAAEDVQKTSPVDASASYLRRVKGAFDARFPDAPLAEQDVVLTVPASFDEGARALTIEAAKRAGLVKLRLVEEPQAAFHCFLDLHRDDLESALEDVRLVVVVDVGGGTTDLTLVRIEPRESGVRMTRIAVGDHLMLGGDNMDLALARRVEEKLGAGTSLGAARFTQLVAQCRAAKEKLLGEAAPESVRITILGTGSRLVGGAISAELTRDEVRALVLDGFFPACAPTERASRRRGALVELGLPYASDAAITRHLAEFMARHEGLAREALGDRAPEAGLPVMPDAVLLNGGVFNGSAIAERLVSVLGAWRGAPVKVLTGTDPDLAVAHGAAAYALARHGRGQRIHGGSARSYFLELGEIEGVRSGVCILPRGTEEGETIPLTKQSLSLKLGRPVRFRVHATTADVRYVGPGDVVPLDDERYVELPPIAAVLGDEGEAVREVPVSLVCGLTEIGTLEIACVEKATERRFKLELELRKASGDSTEARRITHLHPRFAEAVALIAGVYGKPKEGADPRDVKRLRAELERVLGPREQWDTPLLRELFSALLAGMKNRRRTDDHERVWLNLVGYCLRPGLGYPLDAWRVKQVYPAFEQDVQFVNEPQNWAELWTLLRRIAGGLEPKMQQSILDAIEWYIEPPSPRARPRPKGVKKLGIDEMIALAAVLEHVPADRKARVGGHIVERLAKHGAPVQTWWALGRLGARVPFHGSAHNVVPAGVVASWIETALAQDFTKVPQAAFAAATMARRSGDRVRDLPPDVAERVAARLEAGGVSPAWVRMVREVSHLEAADEKRVFGESLPPGLRLLD
jgi:molecular chaperone DnaK (HSP70)